MFVDDDGTDDEDERNLTAWGKILAHLVLKLSTSDLPGTEKSPEDRESRMSEQVWNKIKSTSQLNMTV